MFDGKIMKKQNSLTEGSIPKGILMFALPMLAGQIFQQLYNTADAIIVGRFLSDEAYAAVSSSGSLIFLMISFFVGVAAGAGVVISRYFGAQDKENLRKSVHTTVVFGLLSGIALTVIGVILTPQILRLMGTPENVMPYSVQYFRIFFAGSVGMTLYNLLRSILQAVGDSKHPLYYLAATSVLNVVLDLLFIGGFGWDVWSAAFATSLAQLFSACLCLIRLFRIKEDYSITVRELRMDGAMLKRIVKNGIPAGLQNSIIAIANVVMQSNINSFGDIAMSGCGTYQKLEGFVFLPVNCFNMALTTFVSQNIGADRLDRVKRGNIFGIACGVIGAELIGLLLIVFGEPLSRLFTDNQAAIDVCLTQIKYEAPFFFALSCSHCIAAILRGAGRPMIPMFVMLGDWCIFRVSFVSVLVPIYRDIRIIFVTYPLTWIISTFIFTFILVRGKWLKKNDL